MPDTKRTTSGVLGGLAGLVGLSAVAGVLITATVTPAIAVSGYAASSAITMFDNLPSALDPEQLMLPTTAWAVDPASGEYQPLTQWYDQNRSPVEFDEISPVMFDAILSSEDPRYYQHGGVDLIGTTRAILSNLRGGGETQGGSSISQQYVKNILVQKCEATADDKARETLTAAAEKAAEETGQPVVAPTGDELVAEREKINAACWNDATNSTGTEGIQRKLQEMRYAISLEQKYSKNDILLGYLNIANFGGQTYGIDAAAKYYFGVSSADLTIAQAATLAGMVQNPNTYRIDKAGGSFSNSDGTVMYNKAADGDISDINESMFGPLKELLNDGTITEEQYLAAADPYSSTKGRQLYVLSRMQADGKITHDQYVEAVIAPIAPVITPAKTGCAAAVGAEYFCQYVRSVVENDPAFGETAEERSETLRRGGLNIYTTLDWNLQRAATDSMAINTEPAVVDMRFGAATVSLEASTGRILQITQNTIFRDGADTGDPAYSSIVYAGDSKFGGSQGFSVGSTFKLFTLVTWLEQGHSLNEVINGTVRPPKKATNSCSGDWVNDSNWKPNNFGQGNGRVSTPMDFTRTSLNSGYVAMALQLDLCDIAKVVKKMGVTMGNGKEIPMDKINEVIGSDAVSPMAMASAYATVANGGTYCQPTAIDKVTDSEGNEIAKPERTCTPVLDPKVAATAAYALEGVMTGGTGTAGNARNAPVLGKTGTHEQLQTWLVESSTRVATAVWVGQSIGETNLFSRGLNNIRYTLAREVQGAANSLFGGDNFPGPDSQLIRQVLTDLPSVVGKSVEEGTKILTDLGFEVTVGAPVDSTEAPGIIAVQNPGAGKVGGGSPITISPSNGEGLAVPAVSGTYDSARSTLNAAGFGKVAKGTCTKDEKLDPGTEKVTGTDPAAGTVTNRNAQISVNYSARECG
ncbi:transglycosylase domain-containing protein [Microbacterium sp.]|uniref:transglycosylase domain-containing protein n=1 Tax=Microbacterium sp. TaxID=51671 RepID=UPI003F6FFE87